jgi:hypothetical protein
MRAHQSLTWRRCRLQPTVSATLCQLSFKHRTLQLADEISAWYKKPKLSLSFRQSRLAQAVEQVVEQRRLCIGFCRSY